MARRTEEQAQETRADILAAARKLFIEQGYEASLSSIVADAGITKGALFHHFKNKKALFEEVWTDLQVQMDAEARKSAAAARSKTNPYAAFLAGCRTYLEWVARDDYQKIVLVEGPPVLGYVGWYESDHNLGKDNVRSGIEYLAHKHLVDKRHVPALVVLLQSALNGGGFAIGRKDPSVTPDSLLAAFEMILRGMASEVSSEDPPAREQTD